MAYAGWLSAVGLFFIALLLCWPVQVALGAFAFLIPFDSISSIGSAGSGPTLTRFAGAIAVFILLAVGLATRRLRVPANAALWWSLFIFWGAITLGWALTPQLAWQKLPTALSILLLYLVTTSFAITQKELRGVTFLAVLGGCVTGGIAAFEFYSGKLFLQTERSSLMFGERGTDPNHFGASLLLPLSLAIGAATFGKGAVRAAATLAVAIIGLAILLTMSRGALVAALVIVAVYIFRLGVDRRVVWAIGIVTALIFFMPHEFFVRLALADRGAGRLDIWIASLSLLPRYWLMGAGWNNYLVAYADVAGNAPKFHGYTEGAHNMYLGTFVELGFLGLTFLFLAFRAQLRRAYSRSLVPFEAACWGMLAMGLTLDIAFRKYFWFSWIMLALAERAQSSRFEESSS